MIEYNDSELLYLMFEGTEIALQILFKKYYGLIHKRLHLFHIKSVNYEDFFQEALMSLYDAVNTYSPLYNKSFNRYFDLLLQRKIMTTIRKESNYFYNVNLIADEEFILSEESSAYYYVEEADALKILTDFEIKLYELKFIKRLSPRQISNLLGCDLKKVYNYVYIIKQKLKMYMEL